MNWTYYSQLTLRSKLLFRSSFLVLKTFFLGILCSLIGCTHPDSFSSDRQVLSATPSDQIDSTNQRNEAAKMDRLQQEAFPSTQDLALLFPLDDAQIKAEEVFLPPWFEKVDDALMRSELGESILDESWQGDWSLVSVRIVPCSPLGVIAQVEEIDRLCWPQVRLVWQPIVESLSVHGLIRDAYGDDRAIHTLYRVAFDDPALLGVLESLETSPFLKSIPQDLLSRFEEARDRYAQDLLKKVEAFRLTSYPYTAFDIRPELYTPEESQRFQSLLFDFIQNECLPNALHELTAFSLPLGRNPAGADLWSFVAFSAKEGQLTQSQLQVHDRETGEVLYRFESLPDEKVSEGGQGGSSENVTLGHGDRQLAQYLKTLSKEERERLEEHVVHDIDQLDQIGDQINDPYRTLVANTTCASCHRSNSLTFNFHNLSYLEDQEISISPRVFRDVVHDLNWADQLQLRLNKE